VSKEGWTLSPSLAPQSRERTLTLESGRRPSPEGHSLKKTGRLPKSVTSSKRGSKDPKVRSLRKVAEDDRKRLKGASLSGYRW